MLHAVLAASPAQFHWSRPLNEQPTTITVQLHTLSHTPSRRRSEPPTARRACPPPACRSQSGAAAGWRVASRRAPQSTPSAVTTRSAPAAGK
eukprot:2905050-Prymnesium_polylepis.2